MNGRGEKKYRAVSRGLVVGHGFTGSGLGATTAARLGRSSPRAVPIGTSSVYADR